ncbi:nitroreductase family protein [Acetobacter sp. TBRC 12305]|uniref:Nitroreductase family protein n=1 Tax=Acetobacter garciniae TaxID=2817435 RepID=A0A939HR19_9PROT|nr:nitroreductase family protein [Acetobacter garciniae]MBO1326658.1 nitroreductase family protein [Acetobacter garciniae]MBX0345047.1 nitroreductase family protein [Acetobacter garciniae]
MPHAPDRKTTYPIAPFIQDRWSPRSFQAAPMTEQDLLSILEAGRWAPSAYNAQPWRFLYALHGTPDWHRFLSWLIPFNQSWAETASALVFVASRTVTLSSKTGEPVPAPTHAFDAGAASLLIQLQANQHGWATHPVSGFDKEIAQAGLELPEDYALHAAIIIGRQGDATALPETLREREAPSDRVALADIAFAGRFKGS